jgi:hypothetical protein
MIRFLRILLAQKIVCHCRALNRSPAAPNRCDSNRVGLGFQIKAASIYLKV